VPKALADVTGQSGIVARLLEDVVDERGGGGLAVAEPVMQIIFESV
jgi:hypothetical protein